jgi:hypothetical protein
VPCLTLVRYTFSIDVLHESLVFLFEIGQGSGASGGGGSLINEVEGAMNMDRNGGGNAGGGAGGGGIMNELEQMAEKSF